MRFYLSIRCALTAWILLIAAAVTLAADGDGKTNAGQSSDAARRQFDGAVALHKGGVYDLAVDEWEKFLKKFPDDPLTAQAQFFAGVCYLSLKDKQYDKAREAFSASSRSIRSSSSSTRRTSISALPITTWLRRDAAICMPRHLTRSVS